MNYNCRVCSNKIRPFMSFGRMPIANGFLAKEQFSEEYFFDLSPAFCEHCKMFQIVEQPDPNVMFHENYAFFSSTSKKMAIHFQDMANHYFDKFINHIRDPFVVEIGSNDGIFLRHFASKKIKHLGVEPSKNVAAIASEQGVNTINNFFNENTSNKILDKYGKADIICSANVICHIPDFHAVMNGVDLLLKDSGVFIFEDPYLLDMVQKNSYDQIYDEHVYIFSVQSVINVCKLYNMELFHVEHQDTHGGSMRYYLCKKGTYPRRDSVSYYMEQEEGLKLSDMTSYIGFKSRCEKNKLDLRNLLVQLKEQGKRVVGYAATSKSTTVLNYCNINADLIEYISDTTIIKQNKYSPGMHIPIKPYDLFNQDNPDYAILFAWNHLHEIFEKEKNFVERGGKWITFVPEVEII